MNEQFENAPNMGDEFELSQQEVIPADHRGDDDQWQPKEKEEPDEFNYNPPRKVFDPERVMTPTPFGTVDQDIKHDLSQSDRNGIEEAQNKEPEISDDFDDLRSIDEVPGADEEYEAHLREQEDFQTRMRQRFDQANERDYGLDR